MRYRPIQEGRLGENSKEGPGEKEVGHVVIVYLKALCGVDDNIEGELLEIRSEIAIRNIRVAIRSSRTG